MSSVPITFVHVARRADTHIDLTATLRGGHIASHLQRITCASAALILDHFMETQNLSVIVKTSEIPAFDLTSPVALAPLVEPQPAPPQPQEPAPAGSPTKPKSAHKSKKGKAATGVGKLNAEQVKALAACRLKLSQGDESIAEALTEILDKELFRDKYSSFKNFVSAECNFGKAYAYRMIQANKILNLSTFVDDQKPTNIAQAYALSFAPEAKMNEVMAKATELAGTAKRTARHITNAVNLVAPKPKAAPKGNEGNKAPAPVAKDAKPVKTADALGWVTSLRANIKDPAKVEASLALIDLIELALQSNTLLDVPASKPAAIVTQ